MFYMLKKLNRIMVFKNTKPYFIRPLLSSDDTIIHTFMQHLSKRTIFQRYFQHKKQWSDLEIQSLIENGIGLFEYNWKKFACEGELLGIAELHYVESHSAEFAIMLSDSVQGKGLAKLLIDEIKAIAKQSNVKLIKSSSLIENKKARCLSHLFDGCENRQVNIENGSIDDTYHVSNRLSIYDFLKFRKRKNLI